MFRYVVIFGLLSLSCSARSDFKDKLVIPLDPECVQQSGVTKDDYESINDIDGLYLLMQGRQMDYSLCLAKKKNLITGDDYLQQRLCVDNFKKAIENCKRFFNKEFFKDVEVCYTLDGVNAMICLLFRLKSWVEQNHETLERREEQYDKHFGIDTKAGIDAAENQIGQDGLSPHDRQDIIWHTMNIFHEILYGSQ